MIDDLINIGFYTLSDNRCLNSSSTSDLQRCELLVSSRCNFKCSYCRNIGGPDMPYSQAENVVRLWASQRLKNIRFSGGEPTLYPGIVKLVLLAKELGCEHVAISTNGSASKDMYDSLLQAGCNDFSVSLDACCAADGDVMSGTKGQWDKIVSNIKYLSSKTYVTVGCVLTDANADKVNDIITFADSLGVSDIRIIPAAQGKPVRGLGNDDTDKCGLVLDDMAVCENKHYPCIIYLREGGQAVGFVSPNIRKERLEWYKNHNTKTDPICSKNCLDVCVSFNNKFQKYHSK